MTCEAACIIRRVSFASSIVEVVMPCSGSMPSTPKKTFEQMQSSSSRAASSPSTDSDFLCTEPPSCTTLTFSDSFSSTPSRRNGVTMFR